MTKNGKNMDSAEQVYLRCLEEIKVRLNFVKELHTSFKQNHYLHYLEAAVLQIRKILELLAFSSISPNHYKYRNFRLNAKKPGDHRKDYNGKNILKSLEKINPDFYPIPLLDPQKVTNGRWHFERFTGKFLSKNKYEKVYDRCGALLHADNPWGVDKRYTEFASQISQILEEIKALLQLFFIVVEDSETRNLWVVSLGTETEKARIFKSFAAGEFTVSN